MDPDPDFHPSITPYPNGPYYVNDIANFANRHGPIRTRPTMMLCRCGASATKPFCDGAHVKIGFSSENPKSPAEGKRDSYDELRSGEPGGHPAIFVAPNGPYVVTGGPELRNTRNEGGSTERFALCRCGGSGNKPFCDGSHRHNGFEDRKN